MQASDSFERFDRTQRGPWVLILHAVTAGTIVPAILFAEEMGYWNFLLYGLAVLFEILAFSFLYLNLRDEGDRLAQLAEGKWVQRGLRRKGDP